MGLFDIFKRKPKDSTNYKTANMLTGYAPIFSQFGQNIYASDVVQQAIRCICQEMKKLQPQHELRNGSDVTPLEDSIQWVLDSPNDLMTTADFLEKVVWQLYFNYNAFVLPVWEGDTLTALYPLQPTQVNFVKDSKEEMFVELIFPNGYKGTIRYTDIIHIRYNYSVNEFMGGNQNGQPDNGALLKTLELNETLLQGVGKALKSSFAINGVIKYNTLIDTEKTEKALKELTEALNKNENGFMPLDMKGEFIPFTRQTALVDATTLKFIDEKILRYYGVSLAVLSGDYTTAQYESFYQKTIEPLVIAMSQAFTKALFTNREKRGFNHRITFYPKELVFLTTQQKLETIRLLGDSGGLFENEKRTLLGMKPLKELEGIRTQSLNYVNADIAKQYQLGLYVKNVDSNKNISNNEGEESNNEKE